MNKTPQITMLSISLLVLLISNYTYAQSFKSPYLFKFNSILKSSSQYSTALKDCENYGYKQCSYDYTRSFHEESKEGDNAELYSQIHKYYQTTDFPVGTINQLKKMKVSNSVIKLVESTSNLEALYFEGQVNSEMDSYSYIRPIQVRCSGIIDTDTNEILYHCSSY